MILCEDGPDGRPVLFRDAARIIVAETADQVIPALQEIEAARAKGAWVAGWVGYEAGLAMEPHLLPLMRLPEGEPLLAFGIYDRPEAAPVLPAETVLLSDMTPLISCDDYHAAFARLSDYIDQGDCYQVNLTFPMEGRLEQGTAAGLYSALSRVQSVRHGALVDLGVGPIILSRSPELFFRLDSDMRIEAQPMKGTAPRHSDPARDHASADELFRSEKNRAENLMIVDLLRNDISRLAEIGSVRVPELFQVEPFATVHQMTSRITGKLLGRPGLDQLMRALFPCGSVTGAPKIRAMQIIAELEHQARGVYCGAIGWMAPEGRASFNVAIRTLRLFADGRIILNVGGGIVHDSKADNEWEEALWKARFADLNRR
ncbi:aminodeoxychorismate synthase component I [Falsirhodobacter sp. alg1]|uniref:aminodeoxychorismate synthase component I n=1 Tax=Falsirhodobacter sp. alg1 TaxID=1472418 RepID=UPI0007892C7C|nr:aminodeoxychorismate synthase component I [Falsirhodobacter sp. alg1]